MGKLDPRPSASAQPKRWTMASLESFNAATTIRLPARAINREVRVRRRPRSAPCYELADLWVIKIHWRGGRAWVPAVSPAPPSRATLLRQLGLLLPPPPQLARCSTPADHRHNGYTGRGDGLLRPSRRGGLSVHDLLLPSHHLLHPPSYGWWRG